MADESLKSKQCEGFPSLSLSLSLRLCVCVSVLCAMKSIEKHAGKVIVAYDMENERQRDKKKRCTVINDNRIVEMRMG